MPRRLDSRAGQIPRNLLRWFSSFSNLRKNSYSSCANGFNVPPAGERIPDVSGEQLQLLMRLNTSFSKAVFALGRNFVTGSRPDMPAPNSLHQVRVV